jgi:hypothetical protein
MALWGTNKDKGRGEQKPIWQQDKDPDGVKSRPAINEERNTFASTADRAADPKRKHSGWVRRITKTLPDGTVRVLEELLVSTSNASGVPLPDALGVANVTSVTFRNTSNGGFIAANSVSTIDISTNLHVDVSFNEAVDVPGTVALQLSNSTVNFNINAYPNKWDGISSTAIGIQNNTNLLTFTVAIGPETTGNGQIKITGAGLIFEDAITDNVGGLASNTIFDGNVASILAGGGGNTAVLSTANVVISGNVFERYTAP